MARSIAATRIFLFFDYLFLLQVLLLAFLLQQSTWSINRLSHFLKFDIINIWVYNSAVTLSRATYFYFDQFVWARRRACSRLRVKANITTFIYFLMQLRPVHFQIVNKYIIYLNINKFELVFL